MNPSRLRISMTILTIGLTLSSPAFSAGVQPQPKPLVKPTISSKAMTPAKSPPAPNAPATSSTAAPTDPKAAAKPRQKPAPQLLQVSSTSAAKGKKITDLKLFLKYLPDDIGGLGRIQIIGKYRSVKESYTLTVNLVKVITNDKGIFSFEVPYTDKWATIEAIAVSPKGSIESETFEVQVPDHRAKVKPKAKRHRFSIGFGPTMVAYAESFLKSISAILTTGKISYLYWVTPGGWSLSLSAYSTVMPISVTPADNEPRFFGLNGRVGYLTKILPNPWSLTFAAGFFYTTMPVADFGFTHLMGPQVFPVITRALARGNTLTTYFKFSPIAANMAIQSLSNRELAGGLSYTHLLSSGDALLFSLDGADIYFGADGAFISNRSLSFSVGYGW